MNKYIARRKRALKTKETIKNSRSNRPRLVVFRSNAHIYSQIVIPGEVGDIVLVAASTKDKELKVDLKGNKTDQATQVGTLLAARAKKKELSKVAFDRSGYKYHGRVKALAEAARAAGLEF
jgi:large subunit ribosomal protein L18